MTEGLIKRKLRAILSADAKDYSRLMRSDEEATVRTLTNYRSVIAELVSKYQGRVVDSPGDNILAEFASVVHAVQCGFEIQASLQTENTKLSEDRRMEFRIGINLGDVIQEGKRIYGDGVNVAARMESLAEAGGICVSGSAYDQIENKFAFGCEYLGEQTVKNISTPIRVYRLTRDEAGQGCAIRTQARKLSNRLIFAVVLGMLALSNRDYDRALSYRKKAYVLAPNDYLVILGLGSVLYKSGEPKKATDVLSKAARQNPNHPVVLTWAIAEANLVAEDYEAAIETSIQAIARQPDAVMPHTFLAAAYSALGLTDEAQTEAAKVLQLNPNFTVSAWMKTRLLKHPADTERYANLLLKAGLPEN
jgi:class 3 adenylate cyclase